MNVQTARAQKLVRILTIKVMSLADGALNEFKIQNRTYVCIAHAGQRLF